MENIDFTIDDNDAANEGDNSVSEKDKFRLAKTILLVSFILYLVIAMLYGFGDQLQIDDAMKEVWLLSSQGLFGITNLLIGFYFGDKRAIER